MSCCMMENSFLVKYSIIVMHACVPQSSLHSLFVCLVTPSLDYCCTVWGGRYIYHDNILNKCLKRAARIILQCAFLTPSADMFSKLNWLSFSERVKYRKSTLVFKSVNRMTPRYMTNLFTPLTHFRETRQSTRMALTIPFAKKNCYATSLLYVVQSCGTTCIHNYEQ